MTQQKKRSFTKIFMLLFIASTLVSGCMTSERQDELQTSLTQLKKQVSTLQDQLNNRDQQIKSTTQTALTSQDDLQDIQNQIKLAQGSIDEFKERLKHIEENTQNSKSSQTDMTVTNSEAITRVQRQIAHIELSTNARLSAARKGKLPAKLNQLKELEKILKTHFEQQEYEKVIDTANSVLTAAEAKDNQLQVALEYRAEAKFSSKNYKGAALDFSTYLEIFPNAAKRARSLLLVGDSYVYLNNNIIAKSYYQECATSYANTEEGKAAAERLARLTIQTKENL